MTSTPDRQQLLNLYPVFATLPHDALDRLLRPEAVVRIREGREVFTERQPCRGFPLVIEGSIKVSKYSPNGRELLLYRVVPGGSCVISTSCLLGRSDYNAIAIAESAVTVLVLPAEEFLKLVVEYRPFREFVFHLFGQRLADMMQLVEEIAFARLDQRLARLLLARDTTPLRVTHHELADELGSVREIISRLLKGFASQGLVSLAREQIDILDRSGLEKLAAE